MKTFLYGVTTTIVFLGFWAGCDGEADTSSASNSATGNTTTSAQSTTGNGGNGSGGNAGGTNGAGGSSTVCGDMGLICDADQICVKTIVTMGPSSMTSWSCADDTCAPDPVSCDCAGPICGDGPGSGCMMDGTQLVCTSGGVCASPDTPIATPGGERPIASLSAGDLVYSMHEGKLAAVPLLRATRTRVHDHTVVEVSLASGRVLRISGLHPTADGRSFRDLLPNDFLGSERIVGVATLPYAHDSTYDILPASDSGTYVAAGALIGSTLR
jgi:hypothetical protein